MVPATTLAVGLARSLSEAPRWRVHANVTQFTPVSLSRSPAVVLADASGGSGRAG